MSSIPGVFEEVGRLPVDLERVVVVEMIEIEQLHQMEVYYKRIQNDRPSYTRWGCRGRAAAATIQDFIQEIGQHRALRANTLRTEQRQSPGVRLSSWAPLTWAPVMPACGRAVTGRW